MKQKSVGTFRLGTGQLVKALRKFVLGAPVFVAIYGILVLKGWIGHAEHFNVPTLIGVILALMVLMLSQGYIRWPSRRLLGIYAVAYHVVLVIALVYLFGVNSPFVLVWQLLLVATVSLFGRWWALLSYVAFLGVLAGSLLSMPVINPQVITQYVLFATFVGFIAVAFGSLRSLEIDDRQKLAQAKAKQDEQREALLTIINGTTQAIFTVSTTGVIRIYNAALLSLIDTNQSLSGKRVDDVLTLHDKKGEPVSLFRLMKEADHFERDDLSFTFAEGDELRLHISVNKVRSAFSAQHQNDGEGFVCIARDVTKQKSLEEERDEFISVVSHELRTPVTIAEGTISNVQYFLDHGADPAKLGPSLKEAHEQIMLLATMINDLGTLSRAERGAGDNIEEVDVRELSETLYKSYQSSARKKGLTLNLDTGARLGTVMTSRLYLEEILQNFITNSIKYTVKGSVTLRVKHVPAGVKFTVIDTGIGISKSDIKHIFEKFYRSEDYRTRETSGTGLGLYVVSKLVHKLGTKVEVSSRLNHGSEFSFVLPNTPPKNQP